MKGATGKPKNLEIRTIRQQLLDGKKNYQDETSPVLQ